MVVGPKLSIQNVECKGRISILRLRHLTVQKRRTVLSISYGSLLVIISIILAAINPLKLVTDRLLTVKEGSFLYKVLENLPYDIRTETWIYNYTNVREYLGGSEDVLRVQEVGPFTYREIRTNENMTVNEEKGTLRMKPKFRLEFMPEVSVSGIKDTSVYVPNIPLVALSTIAADRLGYSGNTMAYYSMSALGAKLFKNLTVEEFLWGYHDSLVATANGLLPGWIDFGRLGILDRIYANRDEVVEVELNDASTKYSVQSWNDLPGLKEQGYTDLNTSIPCNLVQNTYEGLMITPNLPKGQTIPIFRKMACRVYPFNYDYEQSEDYGFNVYRYKLDDTAFSRSSPYACNCTKSCLPEGFVDVNKCYYGFPIALSKPHYADVDPVQQSYFDGMVPDPASDGSYLDIEPTLGIPLSFSIKIQVNIAVRMSPGNTLTKPFKDKIIPLMWLNINNNGPPPFIMTLIKLRLIYGPPAFVILVVLLFLGGLFLIVQAVHRLYKPKYKVIQPKAVEMKRRKSMERRKSSILNIVENTAFEHDEELVKQTVSLLDTCEDELDIPDLVVSD